MSSLSTIFYNSCNKLSCFNHGRELCPRVRVEIITFNRINQFKTITLPAHYYNIITNDHCCAAASLLFQTGQHTTTACGNIIQYHCIKDAIFLVRSAKNHYIIFPGYRAISDTRYGRG